MQTVSRIKLKPWALNNERFMQPSNVALLQGLRIRIRSGVRGVDAADIRKQALVQHSGLRNSFAASWLTANQKLQVLIVSPP